MMIVLLLVAPIATDDRWRYRDHHHDHHHDDGASRSSASRACSPPEKFSAPRVAAFGGADREGGAHPGGAGLSQRHRSPRRFHRQEESLG